uniref:Dehydrin2 n=1 Tax=Gentiana triflora TaxID=55190 RepID=I4DEZ0_GENTR|nr:dehydrin2 [Gentiana triflora]
MSFFSGEKSKNTSEDDVQDGRSKKSITDKIKDILPGGNKSTTGQDAHAHGHGAATTPGVYGGRGAEPEKKGIMDKIKDTLPGGNKLTTGQNAYAHGHGATATHEVHGAHSQKGIMEKIKEKLPGHH